MCGIDNESVPSHMCVPVCSHLYLLKADILMLPLKAVGNIRNNYIY